VKTISLESMSVVSTLLATALDTSVTSSSNPEDMSSIVPQASTASTMRQPSPPTAPAATEESSSVATSSIDRDSGYVSAAATQESGILENLRYSFTDGIVLPRCRLFPSKVTKLKIFNQSIPQSTQNRFKDLIELFSKPLCDYLTKAKVSISDISIKLKILGKSETTARPWIVVQCNKDVEKRIKQFFNQKAVKSEYQPLDTDSSLPSFGIFVCVRPPKRAVAANYADIYSHIDRDMASSPTLCGTIIRVTEFDEDLIATIGGLIKVTQSENDVILYGMTAGHIVPRETPKEVVFEFDSSSDEGGNGDDDDCLLDEEETFELDVPLDEEHVTAATSIKREVSLDEEQNRKLSIPWSKIGHISMASQDTPEDGHNLDWALVEIEDLSLYKPNLLVIPEKKDHYHINGELKMQVELNSRDQWSSTSKESVVLLSGMSGFKRGILSSSLSFLLLSPGKNFIKTYSLAFSDSTGMRPVRIAYIYLIALYRVETRRLRILGC
jgi:hypothetical protein